MNDINEAIKYFNEEKFNKAETVAYNIIVLNNDNVDALDVLAAIYLKTNNLNFLKNATEKQINIIRKLAIFLSDLEMFEQAINIYKIAIKIVPRDFVGLNNIGLLYENLHNDDMAIEAYQKSLKIQENYPAAYNLGVIFRKRKACEKSIYYLKKALKFQPDNKTCNYSLGMSYFMEKNFHEGYKYFLKRKTLGIEKLKNFWDGSIQKNKTLLVYCDYGLGDAIMFSRYFYYLKDMFKEVIVSCNDSLKKLFENSFSNIKFVTSYENEIYDYSVLAMNLPYFLKIDFDNIPFSDGYLNVDNETIKYFKDKYFDNNKKKIGIFWLGGEKQKRNAKERAIPLAYFAKCLKIDNTEFYSLQKEDDFEELKEFPEIIDLSNELSDFSKTAGIMKNLDLMISIDSAPVHLAGALGIKTLLLLPYNSEWRWFKDENTTTWYDSIDIIRQKHPYSWENMDANIINYLLQ